MEWALLGPNQTIELYRGSNPELLGRLQFRRLPRSSGFEPQFKLEYTLTTQA